MNPNVGSIASTDGGRSFCRKMYFKNVIFFSEHYRECIQFLVFYPQHATLSFLVIFCVHTIFLVFIAGHMCNRPLGMMTGAIRNSAITASSMWDKYHAPHLARLKARRMGRYISSWTAR